MTPSHPIGVLCTLIRGLRNSVHSLGYNYPFKLKKNTLRVHVYIYVLVTVFTKLRHSGLRADEEVAVCFGPTCGAESQ